MRGVAGLLVALLLGSVVGGGAVAWRESRTTETADVETAAARASVVTSDRTQEAIDALGTTRLYVAPELADQLDDAQRRAVVEALEAAPVPTYLVYTTVSRDARTGNQYDISRQVIARLGDDDSPARLAVVTAEREAIVDGIGERSVYPSQGLLGGRLPQGMVRYAQALAAEESEPPYVDRDVEEFNLAGGDYYGGLVGGFFVGLLYGGGLFLVLLVLVALTALLLRRRLPAEDR
ncbi:MAG: hypothetical protein Q7T56_04370 [Nocardioidaceae bacterium]|nr:hypothetical protein [Nocardioidaceae bacterium]